MVSVPDYQPLSQSLNVPAWNQDTIPESVDGPGMGEGDATAGEGVWMGNGGGTRRSRRRRASSVMRMIMWVVTEDNR